ncbi:HNH endonuclease signature motif containing protein [Lysinibacillus sphaericus]|uniref:HNH endonuclease signature motif containing protein n=1 Tax=Lysinibacillus sphaericus TaxID=1421 RepID=UPI0021071A85|nr:HNH endonuclease signature motif containing protein [Lysinibacillus sp. SDF0037]
MLRVSHFKPWKDSTNEERLDAFNALLLCCNHDALYDKGYIAFDGTGKIHISERIDELDYAIFNKSLLRNRGRLSLAIHTFFYLA